MVAAVTAALVLGACSSGDAAEDDDLGVQPIEDSEPPTDDGSDEPVPDPDDEADEDPEPDPEPEEVDPFAIPDDIDEAYVDLVMNELLAIDSAVLRDVLSREPGSDLEEEDFERLRAIFSGPQLIGAGEEYLEFALAAESRRGFLSVEELGDIAWNTRRIMEASDSCLLAIGYYDLTRVSTEPYADDLFVMASLEPAPDDREDVQTHNQTPWRIHDLNALRAGGEPIPEEDWDRLDYEATLSTTCN